MTHRRAQGTAKQLDRQMIAILNDGLREHLTAPGRNRVVTTQGIAALIGDVSCYAGFTVAPHYSGSSAIIAISRQTMIPMASMISVCSSSRLPDACGRSIITIRRWRPGPRTRQTPL